LASDGTPCGEGWQQLTNDCRIEAYQAASHPDADAVAWLAIRRTGREIQPRIRTIND